MGAPPILKDKQRQQKPEWVQGTTNQMRALWQSASVTVDGAAEDALAFETLNPLIIDEEVGLGLLARAHLLRDVFKTERVRDFDNDPFPNTLVRVPGDSDLLHIDSNGACTNLFSSTRLTLTRPAPSSDEKQASEGAKDLAAAKLLRDPLWQRNMVLGRNKDGWKGLNDWFRGEYARELPGGVMTPERLFKSRFFGPDAPDRFLRFIYTGIYTSGINTSLLVASRFEVAPDRLTSVHLLVKEFLATEQTGDRIFSVRCPGEPSLATAIAARIARSLTLTESALRAVCYVPLEPRSARAHLNDAGMRSIVDALYLFVQGYRVLSPAITPQDVQTPLDVKVREIRRHLTTTPTILIFDGYVPPTGPYPITQDFVRDEPLRKLLRLLEHPVLLPGRNLNKLDEFNKSCVVIIGDDHPPFLPDSQVLKLDSTGARDTLINSVTDLLGATETAAPIGPFYQSEGERRLGRFLDDWIQSRKRNAGETLTDNSTKGRFEAYWKEIKDWQRLLLQALVLTETGLRWSTCLQIFQCYIEISRRYAGANKKKPPFPGAILSMPGAEEFLHFIHSVSAHDRSAILATYVDGLDAEATEPFEYPHELVFSVQDAQHWISLVGQKVAKGWVVGYASAETKEHVAKTITHAQRLLLRRIMSELALQAHRIRLRHGPRTRAGNFQLVRSLVEALFHGFQSIPEPGDKTEMSNSDVNYKIRVIPGQPGAAFLFLYFSVYRDLLCNGALSGIGAQFGFGDLEAELLLLISHRHSLPHALPAVVDIDRAANIPEWLRSRKTLDEVASRRAVIAHLLAVCQCAQRGVRIGMFERALQQLHCELFANNDAPIDHADMLSYLKLRIDLLTNRYDTSDEAALELKHLKNTAIEAISSCVVTDSTRARKIVDAINQSLINLDRETFRYLRDRFRERSLIEVHELEDLRETAIKSLGRGLPTRLPPDAVSCLVRLGSAVASIGDHRRSKAEWERALRAYLKAFVIFGVAKKVALGRADNQPYVKQSKVSSRNVEDYMRVISASGELLRGLGKLDRHVRSSLERTARSTLDTYSRERASNKADHISMQILECTYARSALALSLQFAQLSSGPAKADEKSQAEIFRCLEWLNMAEDEMLAVTGRPGLRVLFCSERLDCLINLITLMVSPENWSTQLSKNYLAKVVAVTHWINHDLRQISKLLLALKAERRESNRESKLWRSMLLERIGKLHSVGNWLPRIEADEWLAAKHRLINAVVELSDAHDSQTGRSASRTTPEPPTSQELPAPDGRVG